MGRGRAPFFRKASTLRKAKQSESSRMMRPALTPEARENQLVSLAVDLAEKQLRVPDFIVPGADEKKQDEPAKIKVIGVGGGGGNGFANAIKK